jgi:hypothetical protein
MVDWTEAGKGALRMDADDFEMYPIAHNGRVYNIFTREDMTFREVRAMLDWLDAQGAFTEDEALGPGKIYSCPVEDVVLEVDVQGFEVIVYRRGSAR